VTLEGRHIVLLVGVAAIASGLAGLSEGEPSSRSGHASVLVRKLGRGVVDSLDPPLQEHDLPVGDPCLGIEPRHLQQAGVVQVLGRQLVG